MTQAYLVARLLVILWVAIIAWLPMNDGRQAVLER